MIRRFNCVLEDRNINIILPRRKARSIVVFIVQFRREQERVRENISFTSIPSDSHGSQGFRLHMMAVTMGVGICISLNRCTVLSGKSGRVQQMNQDLRLNIFFLENIPRIVNSIHTCITQTHELSFAVNSQVNLISHLSDTSCQLGCSEISSGRPNFSVRFPEFLNMDVRLTACLHLIHLLIK